MQPLTNRELFYVLRLPFYDQQDPMFLVLLPIADSRLPFMPYFYTHIQSIPISDFLIRLYKTQLPLTTLVPFYSHM